MSPYVVRHLLHPATGFISGYRNLVMPRASKAEEPSPQISNQSNDSGILVPYLATSKCFLDRQGGGKVSLRTKLEPTAAALVLKGVIF